MLSCAIDRARFEQENPMGAIVQGRVREYLERPSGARTEYRGTLKLDVDAVVWVGPGFSRVEGRTILFGPFRGLFRRGGVDRIKPGDTLTIELFDSPVSLGDILVRRETVTVGLVASYREPLLRTVWKEKRCVFDLLEARRRAGRLPLLYYRAQRWYKY